MFDINGNTLVRSYTIYGDSVDDYIPGRTLVFEDNFGILNESVWGYEIGNVRNNERQFYRRQNVAIENGKLVITAKREVHLNKEWTSGSLTSQLKFSQQYGRFEAKIKFPQIAGAFPAFWTLGANHWIDYSDDSDATTANSKPEGSVPWPQCGENDIVEHYPGDSSYVTMGAIVNENGGTDSVDLGRVRNYLIDLSEYHVYALEWDSDNLKFFVDGNLVSSIANPTYTDAFRQPHYMLLNLAVGASGGTPPDDVNEMKMYVDWVRVYAPLT